MFLPFRVALSFCAGAVQFDEFVNGRRGHHWGGEGDLYIPLPQVKLMWNLQFKPCRSVCCSNLEFFFCKVKFDLKCAHSQALLKKMLMSDESYDEKMTSFKNACISCLIVTNLASAALQYALWVSVLWQVAYTIALLLSATLGTVKCSEFASTAGNDESTQ